MQQCITKRIVFNLQTITFAPSSMITQLITIYFSALFQFILALAWHICSALFFFSRCIFGHIVCSFWFYFHQHLFKFLSKFCNWVLILLLVLPVNHVIYHSKSCTNTEYHVFKISHCLHFTFCPTSTRSPSMS